MRGARTVLTVLALMAGALPWSVDPVAASTAVAACESPPKPGQPVTDIPWQQLQSRPERVWPFSRGGGVTVAVLATGVDAGHAQFRGADVLAGFDVTGTAPDGRLDCVGGGTAVASVIVGQGEAGFGFFGWAPDATILPVQVAIPQQVDADGVVSTTSSIPFDVGRYAEAIRRAVDAGAGVIALPLAVRDPDPAVEAAIAYAAERDAVVVAAIGDWHDTDPETTEDPPGYPAGYGATVVGVGGIDRSGSRTTSSNESRFVDLVAPGDAVVAAAPVYGYEYRRNTSIAVGFVAATAALVRSRFTDMGAAEVSERLLATAGVSRGGRPEGPAGQVDLDYGYGEVDPYRAVTEEVLVGEPQVPTIAEPSVDPVAVAAADRFRENGDWAMLGLVVGGVTVLLLAVGAFVLPRGRRREWLPGRGAAPRDRPLDEGAADIPPEDFFAPRPLVPPAPPTP